MKSRDTEPVEHSSQRHLHLPITCQAGVEFDHRTRGRRWNWKAKRPMGQRTNNCCQWNPPIVLTARSAGCPPFANGFTDERGAMHRSAVGGHDSCSPAAMGCGRHRMPRMRAELHTPGAAGRFPPPVACRQQRASAGGCRTCLPSHSGLRHERCF